MADTTDTTPGSAPGVLTTGADGGLPDDLGGRRAWVWMQDTDEGGGGRFDVRADRVAMWLRKGATVVPNYPINFTRSARTPKPALRRFAGQPDGGEAFAPRTPTPGDGEPTDQPTDQPTDGPVENKTPDSAPAPAEADSTDQTDGESAAANTTTRKGGRAR